jgi:uncharacterized membrane protein
MKNKSDFFAVFQKNIRTLPKKEQNDLLADYEEHFELAIFEGRSEQEAIASLGDPKRLAKEHVMDYYLEQTQKIRSYGSLMRVVSASLGLDLLNLVFVLVPFIAIATILAVFYIVSITFLLTPLAAILSLFTGIDISLGIFYLSISIALSGMGMLILVGNIRFTRLSYHWFAKYLQTKKWNIRGVVK